MIVDLNLQDKVVMVIGGGNEAQKRISSLLMQGCKIIVITSVANLEIDKLAKARKIKLKKQQIQDTEFISEYRPDIIITTTDSKEINQQIINSAKRNKIMVYSSDNPEDSDFANGAIIDFEGTIQVGIFTGGRSPAMSKRIKAKSEEIFRKAITQEDIGQIKIQRIARKLAKKAIPTQDQRRDYLQTVMADNEIDQLIKDGQMKKAEKRAITILRNWK